MFKVQTIAFLLLATFIVSTVLAANTEQPKYDNTGRYNPYYQDPYYNNRDYYNNRYYKNNREYYNNRQYYDNHFKNYNPNVVGAQAKILEQEIKTPEDGAYSYSYDTENGIHFDERGVSIQNGKEEQKEVVEGSYSFVTPEGVQVLVRYTADEKGFHPTITYGGAEGAQFARRPQSADVVVTKSN